MKTPKVSYMSRGGHEPDERLLQAMADAVLRVHQHLDYGPRITALGDRPATLDSLLTLGEGDCGLFATAVALHIEQATEATAYVLDISKANGMTHSVCGISVGGTDRYTIDGTNGRVYLQSALELMVLGMDRYRDCLPEHVVPPAAVPYRLPEFWGSPLVSFRRWQAREILNYYDQTRYGAS